MLPLVVILAITAAVLAVLIYFAVTQGLPWLKTAMGSGSTGVALDGGSAYCIDQASAASDTIADELVANARPPVDASLWSLAVMRAGSALGAAENACSCPTAACNKGLRAVDELRVLFDDLDQIARGNPLGVGNPARRQERVYELLNEARSMARSE